MADILKQIVQEGYSAGNYAAAFRKSPEPTPFEHDKLCAFSDLVRSNFHQRHPSDNQERPRVLDLGCGPGIPYDLFLYQHQHFRLTLVDSSECHLKLNRDNFPADSESLVERKKGDITDPSLFVEGEKFDGAIMLYVLFHLPREEHASFLRYIFTERLAPGAPLLLTISCSEEECNVENDWFGVRMAWSSFSSDVTLQLLRDAGFHIVNTWNEGIPGEEEFHLWALVQKPL